MRLSLLSPLALGLGVLLLGPLVAHMARQEPRQRLAYGAMMLMQRLVKRIRRERRLRDLFLLALRLATVLLVVLGVSRPLLVWPGDVPEVGASGRVVVILDNSLSMGLVEGGESMLAKARDKAVSMVESLPEGTELALVRVSGEATALQSSLQASTAAIVEGILSTEQGYGGTDLAGALHEARALLDGEPGEVLVFTDGVGPGVVEAAQSELTWLLEGSASVIPILVRSDHPQNLTVSAAEYGEGLEGGSITVVVKNHGDRQVEAPVTVGLPDGSEITVFTDLPPGEEVEERFTVPPEVPGGVSWVRVEDSSLPVDNTRYFHLPRVGASRVMVIDGDPGTTPVRSETYFLERALAPWGALRGGVLPEVGSPASLATLDPESHRVVFLANVAEPGPYAARLVDFVRAGGGLVVSGGENVTAQRYNGVLRDLLPSLLRKSRNLVGLDATGGNPLVLPDGDLPVFRAFNRSGRAGLARITARRVLTFEPFSESEEVRTLATWEGGIPALVERQVGLGRVLVWTSTLDTGWGNAPLQAAFLPLIQQLVGALGGEAQGSGSRHQGLVGTQVTVPLGSILQSHDPVLRNQEGVEVPYRREETRDGIVFTPHRPGAYHLSLEGAAPLAWIAINTDPVESNLTPGLELAEAEAEIAPELFLREASLGLGALWAALALLLLQGLVSRRPARGGKS